MQIRSQLWPCIRNKETDTQTEDKQIQFYIYKTLFLVPPLLANKSTTWTSVANNYLPVFSSHSLPVLLDSVDEKLSEGHQALPEETSHSPTAAGYDYIRSLWLALHNISRHRKYGNNKKVHNPIHNYTCPCGPVVNVQ